MNFGLYARISESPVNIMADIVVVGSMNMDFVVKVARAPVAGETLLGKEFHTIPGGKGANQAVAVACLGGNVSIIGRVGKDGFGEQLSSNLFYQHVDNTHIHIDPQAPTGVALIVVDDTGENRIIVIPGANGKINKLDISEASEMIIGARLLLMQFEIPIDVVEYTANLAFDQHVPVLLNPAPAYPISENLLKKITYLVLNETEARTITGLEVNSPKAAQRVAELLVSKGPQVVILTMGAMGAVLADNSTSQLFPAYKVTSVDATAAGDAFIGGLSVALLEDIPMTDKVRFANAAGALATTKIGAQTSLPSRQEVDEFIKSYTDTCLIR
jgi:ribokinase